MGSTIRPGVLTVGLVAALLWRAAPIAHSADLATHALRATAAVEGCPTPAPTTAAGYQAMFDAKNDAGWSGGDQAATVALPGGRTLWLFADTMQGHQAPTGGYAPDARLVHNSLLIQDGGCLTSVAGRHGGEVIPNAVDGSFYWPQTGLVENGRLVVLALRVRATGVNTPDFRTSGCFAAVFLITEAAPKLERVVPLPGQPVGDHAPAYCVAAATTGGYTYVYGTATVAGALGKAVYVARVAAGRLLRAAAWRFWNGSRWSTIATEARPIVGAAPRGWSTSFSVDVDSDGKVRMVTKENEFLGSDLVTGVADLPVGPFTRAVVGHIPSGPGGDLRYTPLAHPQTRLAGGALLVSYSRNNSDLAAVLRDADYYKPQFLAIVPG